MKNHFDDIPSVSQSIQYVWRRTGLSTAQGLFIVAGVIAVGLSYPSFVKYQAAIERDKAVIDQATAQRRELQIQFDSEKEQAEIANARYKTCLPVVGETMRNGTHYFSGIQKGVVIHDRITGRPLVKGTIICDAFGQTASVGADGTPQHFAFTGDRDVIQARLKRFRGSQFSQPVAN